MYIVDRRGREVEFLREGTVWIVARVGVEGRAELTLVAECQYERNAYKLAKQQTNSHPEVVQIYRHCIDVGKRVDYWKLWRQWQYGKELSVMVEVMAMAAATATAAVAATSSH